MAQWRGGAVARYLARFPAERAAMPILGVTGVVNAVELGVAVGKQRPNADIARDGVQLLARQLPLAELKIGVLVRSGWLTLDGEVDWFYQKELAEAAIRTVAGLQGIANTIEVRPKFNPDEIKHQIADAFRRGAGRRREDTGTDARRWHCVDRHSAVLARARLG